MSEEVVPVINYSNNDFFDYLYIRTSVDLLEMAWMELHGSPIALLKYVFVCRVSRLLHCFHATFILSA